MKNITLDGIVYNLGFRVLTEDMRSLGLRRNKNILTYPVGEWFYLPEKDLKAGVSDWGGIWVTRTLSGAKGLVRYMKEKHGVKTRLFEAAFDKVLYANSYRIKTDGIYLTRELDVNL